MKKLFMVSLVSVLFLGVSGVGLCSEKQLITLLGIRIGSAGHMFATKISESITTHVPEVSATIITGSSKENPGNIQRKRGQIGFTSADYAAMAYKGIKDYEGNPCKDLRHFFFFVVTLDNWFVRADSNIKSIYDLKDKKLNAGPKGYALSEGALASLEAHGLTPEIIQASGGNVSFASDADAVRMLQDRVIDAIFAHTGKSSIITQLRPAEETIGIRPLNYELDKLNKTIEILDREAIIMEVDGGVYKAEPEPVLSFGTPFIFVISADLPEDVVYKMTKAVWENADSIRQAVGPFFNAFRLENALLGASIPIHPGAEKYYREKKLLD